MKSYFAYIRVSTTRQGEEGVSLQVQRAAILEFASRRGNVISEWFEEQLSAAKRGRPVFSKMVSLLKARKAAGVIFHKIDRGARNLKDWADVAELMDRGIEVHFAHEGIDLRSRTGRLSADILAVVAADYIRNLREEVAKGINGRLRQGLYPFAAPVGYLNNGSGKAKTIDPERGPFVKLAFELYATRQYSLKLLMLEIWKRGMRNRYGNMLTIGQWATVLRNPFYMGLIRLRNRKDTFPGIHIPLISSSLFNQVQIILDGKRSRLRQQNRFLFQLLLRCDHCGYRLVGERKKGHVYYRCHPRSCVRTCMREERFESAVAEVLKRFIIQPEEEAILKTVLVDFGKRQTETLHQLRRECEAELGHIRESIQLLLQKFLDNSIPKETFEESHGTLLMQRSTCEERLATLNATDNISAHLQKFMTDLNSLPEIFCTGTFEAKRKLLSEVFMNISGTHDKIAQTVLAPLMAKIANRERTRESWEELLPAIIKEAIIR